MLGYLRSAVKFIAGTEARTNISLLVLTILGMVVGGIYTLANDGWFSGETPVQSSQRDQVATDRNDGARSSEADPSVINSSGEDTINVNSSEARDITIEGAK